MTIRTTPFALPALTAQVETMLVTKAQLAAR
jgi:hypothetical protein